MCVTKYGWNVNNIYDVCLRKVNDSGLQMTIFGDFARSRIASCVTSAYKVALMYVLADARHGVQGPQWTATRVHIIEGPHKKCSH